MASHHPQPQIYLIAAMTENRVIGRNNALPWHLPADLKHFRLLTSGHTIIMGRKTFESFGRPLPERRNIVVTRDPDNRPDGVEIAAGLEEAIDLASAEDEVFIGGGEQIYRLALPRAVRIYLTLIHAEIEGDTFFPEFDRDYWFLAHEEHRGADEKNRYRLTFQRYDRAEGTGRRDLTARI